MKLPGHWLIRLGACLAELFLLRAKRKPAADAQAAATDAREAVARHDEDAVNTAIENARLRRAARRRSGFCAIEIVAAILILALCLAFGCVRTRTRTLVIPADRHVVHIVHEGVEGWFVPDATMADLVESYVLDSPNPKGE
jgi:hypothetical protein